MLRHLISVCLVVGMGALAAEAAGRGKSVKPALKKVAIGKARTPIKARPPKLIDVSEAEFLVHINHESGGNDWAIGDRYYDKAKKHPRPPSEWAYGPLQIRRKCVEDVNARFGTHYTSRQCLGNRPLSKWIMRAYWSIYATPEAIGRAPTAVDRAGVVNGGPNGWRSPLTVGYRQKYASMARSAGVRG